MAAAKTMQPRRRHLDPCLAGKLMDNHFPRPDVPAVVAAWELGNPERTVRVCVVSLGPGTAQRTSRC